LDLAVKPLLATENFQLIRMGMSQAEVEKLLGGPPGDYGHNVGGWTVMTLEGVGGPPGSVERRWNDDSNFFEVFFDADGRVILFHKRAGFTRSPPEGVFAGLRRKLGLR
jgi:hypothetical protein